MENRRENSTTKQRMDKLAIRFANTIFAFIIASF